MRRNKNSKIDFSKAWFSKAFHHIFRERLPQKCFLTSDFRSYIKNEAFCPSHFDFLLYVPVQSKLIAKGISCPLETAEKTTEPSMLCNGSVARQPRILTRYVEKWRKRHQGLSNPRAIKGDANFDKIVNLAFAWPFGPLPSLENMVKNCSVMMWKVHNWTQSMCLNCFTRNAPYHCFRVHCFLVQAQVDSEEVEMSFT